MDGRGGIMSHKKLKILVFVLCLFIVNVITNRILPLSHLYSATVSITTLPEVKPIYQEALIQEHSK